MTNAKFPDHSINPKNKGEDFHKDYARAAWDKFTNSNIKMFYKAKEDYRNIDDYMLGQQSSDKYKKYLLGNEPSDDSWMATNWQPREVATKLVNIAISKIYQRMYRPKATPVDPLAQTEKDDYYTEVKALVLAREAAMQVNPALAQSPALAPKNPKDPKSMEELEMNMNLGVPFKSAMEAELGIAYVFTQNNFLQQRMETITNMVHYGPGGYKEWVDKNGHIRHRDVDPAAIVIDWCTEKDFSDAEFVGEVIEISAGNLPFDKETRKKIYEQRNQRQSPYSKPMDWESDKIEVLDLVFLTWDERVYETRETDEGNVIYRRSKYENRNKSTKTTVKGNEVDKFETKTVEVWHEVKWVIGTDYVYDFGPCSYQNRPHDNPSKSFCPYHLFASGMKKMQCSSLVRKLIPIIDEYNTTTFKIENFKAKWIPYVINIDIQAMESVALGQSGGNMTAKEILELVFQNFVALGRRMDTTGALQNYKMVDIEATGMHQEYTVLAGDLARLLGEMREVTGLNDLTDGSTPGERTLNYVASLGAEATNNALYPIMYAEKYCAKSLSKAVLQRLVQVVKNGNVEGVARVLGEETVRFIKVTKDISERWWDVDIEDIPSAEERQMLLAELNGKDQQGLLEPDDIVMIMETPNLKQARVLLAYKINKKKKELQQFEIQKMRENGNVQQQSSIVAEEEKRKTLELEYKLKTDLELAKLEKEKELIVLKNSVSVHATNTAAATKVVTQHMQNEAKANETPAP